MQRTVAAFQRLRWSLLVISVLIMSGLPLMAAAGTNNLVANGRFERPTIHHSLKTIFAPGQIGAWTVSAGSVDLLHGYWQNDSGEQSIDLTGLSAGTIYQDIATAPGTTYRIQFALAGNPDGVPVVKSVRVTFAGVSKVFQFDTTGHTYEDMGWVTRHIDVLATDLTTRLEFESLDDTTGGPAIDSVSATVAAK